MLTLKMTFVDGKEIKVTLYIFNKILNIIHPCQELIAKQNLTTGLVIIQK